MDFVWVVYADDGEGFACFACGFRVFSCVSRADFVSLLQPFQDEMLYQRTVQAALHPSSPVRHLLILKQNAGRSAQDADTSTSARRAQAARVCLSDPTLKAEFRGKRPGVGRAICVQGNLRCRRYPGGSPADPPNRSKPFQRRRPSTRPGRTIACTGAR